MFKIRVDLDKPIVPDKMFFDGKTFIITQVDPQFVIRSYYLFIDEDKHVQKLFVPHRHPNCDPESGLFCLPDFVKKIPFSKDVKSMIHCWLSCFNLENSYFMPWGYCKYMLM